MCKCGHVSSRAHARVKDALSQMSNRVISEVCSVCEVFHCIYHTQNVHSVN